MKSGNLNFLEPSGPLQACNGTDLPFTLNRGHTNTPMCSYFSVAYNVEPEVFLKEWCPETSRNGQTLTAAPTLPTLHKSAHFMDHSFLWWTESSHPVKKSFAFTGTRGSKIDVFWDVTPCGLVHSRGRFREARCLHRHQHYCQNLKSRDRKFINAFTTARQSVTAYSSPE
jgi:hypothetical protein